MSAYILPVLIVALFIYARFKKVNVYNTFVSGAKNSIDLVFSIFPYILAILIAVALFKASGLSLMLTKLLSPIFNSLGIPSEVCELVLLRPFTGSGSYALLNDIYTTYGVDSYISRCASIILASSETLFYVATIYTSKTKIKNLVFAIPLGIFASIFSAVVSCLLCKIM